MPGIRQRRSGLFQRLEQIWGGGDQAGIGKKMLGDNGDRGALVGKNPKVAVRVVLERVDMPRAGSVNFSKPVLELGSRHGDVIGGAHLAPPSAAFKTCSMLAINVSEPTMT